MKVLEYNLCALVNRGTEVAPVWEEILIPVAMGWNEVNEAIAAREAHNGAYSIVEREEEIAPPTRLDAMEAQLAYTAMMTDTLLEV